MAMNTFFWHFISDEQVISLPKVLSTTLPILTTRLPGSHTLWITSVKQAQTFGLPLRKNMS